jgi:hypothetical protein
MATQELSANLLFFRDFFKRFLPNSQAVALAIILIVSFVLIYSLSGLLMPVFVSIVLAYLLEGVVSKAEDSAPAGGVSGIFSVYGRFGFFIVLLDTDRFATGRRACSAGPGDPEQGANRNHALAGNVSEIDFRKQSSTNDVCRTAGVANLRAKYIVTFSGIGCGFGQRHDLSVPGADDGLFLFKR